MTRVAIVGSGGIGHALAAMLGCRPDLTVSLWGRRWREPGPRVFTCLNAGAACAVGRATAEPDIRRAVQGSDIVVLAVPTHARHQILEAIADELSGCALLLSWEGTGAFRESLRAVALTGPACAGLQRSPIVARVLRHGESCDLRGIRSSVVAGAVEPGERARVQDLLAALLPFPIAVAPSFEHVSVSPGNPLIHPARLFAIARAGQAAGSDGFYAGWDDDASEILLALHGELATLRDALGLSKAFVATLADRDARLTPARLTAEIRGEHGLADVPIPGRDAGGRTALDWDHRFFREDIEHGLSYIVGMARNAGVRMPTAESVLAWYDAGPGAGTL